MRERVFLFFSISLIILFIGLLGGCKKKGKEGFLSFGEEKEIPVSIWKVKKVRRVPIVLEYPGKTKSSQKVVITSRISGTLEKVLFKEGEFVKKGEPLFLIERDIYESRYNSAKAAFMQAKAQYSQAEKTWARIKKAYAKGAISPEQKDRAYSQYQLAEASLALSKARLKEAEIFLNYTTITAPISGVISDKKVSEGNLVNPGTTLAKINKLDPIYVYFSIPDEDIVKYNLLNPKSPNYIKKLKIKLKINKKIYSFSGRVDYVDSVLDPSTASLRVRAVFPNHEKQILANLFVRVRLLGVKERNVLLVPKRSVLWSPEGEKVFLIKNKKVFERFITIVGEWKDFYLVKEGLKEGDKIAVDNLMRLKPGISVKVIKAIER